MEPTTINMNSIWTSWFEDKIPLNSEKHNTGEKQEVEDGTANLDLKIICQQ